MPAWPFVLLVGVFAIFITAVVVIVALSRHRVHDCDDAYAAYLGFFARAKLSSDRPTRWRLSRVALAGACLGICDAGRGIEPAGEARVRERVLVLLDGPPATEPTRR